jgi:hypothetical protein
MLDRCWIRHGEGRDGGGRVGVKAGSGECFCGTLGTAAFTKVVPEPFRLAVREDR